MPAIPVETEAWRARRRHREASPLAEVWTLLDDVKDPEIPVLSLWDLGILQDVREQNGELIVIITPSYCGCPAMAEIEADILARLKQAGWQRARVETRLSPAWSTDWMSPEAREALRGYGIAPPCTVCAPGQDHPDCPRCGSSDTRCISEFGSTACKSLWQCADCAETFDYFKPI